eukprot:TRINITY_DN8033_c0_g1_i1.p1 TRINITY_DN8033_c0_g1~~TRINITY_DN8033_c0_g1_i1.p1  ORF type:complete len:628 (+),score=149.27 TRINITY_DN8033_c0_g1_i1:384-2267(+)
MGKKLESLFGKNFKSAKCCSLLKTVLNRIKLLKNKREIQCTQYKKDIASLLQKNQISSALSRVELLVKEQSTLGAYVLIEGFCYLVTERINAIEKQKTCPTDLKEAITSLVFAAPRCADLPELQEVRSLFTAKYGPEFTAAAAELPSENGVNKQIIENLSTKSPSVEFKLCLMKEVAVENQIEWDFEKTQNEMLKPAEDFKTKVDGKTDYATDKNRGNPDVSIVANDVGQANANKGGSKKKSEVPIRKLADNDDEDDDDDYGNELDEALEKIAIRTQNNRINNKQKYAEQVDWKSKYSISSSGSNSSINSYFSKASHPVADDDVEYKHARAGHAANSESVSAKTSFENYLGQQTQSPDRFDARNDDSTSILSEFERMKLKSYNKPPTGRRHDKRHPEKDSDGSGRGMRNVQSMDMISNTEYSEHDRKDEIDSYSVTNANDTPKSQVRYNNMDDRHVSRRVHYRNMSDNGNGFQHLGARAKSYSEVEQALGELSHVEGSPENPKHRRSIDSIQSARDGWQEETAARHKRQSRRHHRTEFHEGYASSRSSSRSRPSPSRSTPSHYMQSKVNYNSLFDPRAFEDSPPRERRYTPIESKIRMPREKPEKPSDGSSADADLQARFEALKRKL